MNTKESLLRLGGPHNPQISIPLNVFGIKLKKLSHLCIHNHQNLYIYDLVTLKTAFRDISVVWAIPDDHNQTGNFLLSFIKLNNVADQIDTVMLMTFSHFYGYFQQDTASCHSA